MTLPVDQEAVCPLCGVAEDHEGNDMIACDGCNEHYHERCVGLRSIPRGQWFCPACVRQRPTQPVGPRSAYAEELAGGRAAFLARRVASTTYARYLPAFQAYTCFCARHGLRFKEADSLVLYTMHLATRTQRVWNGIATDLSGVGFFVPGILDAPDVQAAMESARRLTAHRASFRKRPLTPELLAQVRAVLRATEQADFYKLRDWSFFLLGFLGLFRASELTALCWTDLSEDEHGLRVLLRTSKTDPYYRGATVFVPGHEQAVLDVRFLLARLRTWVPSASHVFTDIHGNQLTPETLRGRLKRYLRQVLPESEVAGFSLHSLRRGGATAMARQHVPVRIIKRHGRWRSDAVMVYIEAEGFEARAGALVLGSLLV